MNSTPPPDPLQPLPPTDAPPSGTSPLEPLQPATNPESPSAVSAAAQKVVESAQQAGESVRQTAQEWTQKARATSTGFVEARKSQMDRNPSSVLLQALAVGFAIGVVIRLLEAPAKKSMTSKRKREIDLEHKPTIEETKFHLGSIFLPFLWPIFQGAQRGYERSTEGVQDALKQAKKTAAQVQKAATAAQKAGQKSVKKSAKKAGDWVDDEITPVVESGWKKLQKFWSRCCR